MIKRERLKKTKRPPKDVTVQQEWLGVTLRRQEKGQVIVVKEFSCTFD